MKPGISMKYRDKNDILATILQAANGGATRSKIISNTFLNYSASLEYLKKIQIENRLLEYSKEDRIFKTTAKAILLQQKITGHFRPENFSKTTAHLQHIYLINRQNF
jgi:predicted transcriptional regulator